MSSPGQFRGIHNGGWKKGYLSYDYKRSEYLIVNSQGSWPVLLESVGQYTGINDMNGKEIYEGDIVTGKNSRVGFIEYEEGSILCCNFYRITGEKEVNNVIFHQEFGSQLEVIGDRHATPELLENE